MNKVYNFDNLKWIAIGIYLKFTKHMYDMW